MRENVRDVEEALAESLPLRARGEGEPPGEPAVEGGGEVDDAFSGLIGGRATVADTERMRERRESFCFTISVRAAHDTHARCELAAAVHGARCARAYISWDFDRRPRARAWRRKR
jgi:hypothetical protein